MISKSISLTIVTEEIGPNVLTNRCCWVTGCLGQLKQLSGHEINGHERNVLLTYNFPYKK